jgi:hypothetical protein
MNQKELEIKLNQLNIRPDSYSLYGADYNERLVLSQQANDTWFIYYSERGIKRDLEEFHSESKACERFLRKILASTTTRIKTNEKHEKAGEL